MTVSPTTGYLGWTAECGHKVYASKDYYSGEFAQCDKCGRWVEIPVGFYNKIPAHYYRVVHILTMISLSALFLFLGNAFGNPPWWIVLVLLPWLILTMWLSGDLVLIIMARLVKGSTPESGGLIVVSRCGLRAAIGVTDIGLYMPIFIYGLLAATYIGTHFGGVGLPAWIRNPWSFIVIGTILAMLSTAVATSLAFKFAPPRLKKFFAESETEKTLAEEFTRALAAQRASGRSFDEPDLDEFPLLRDAIRSSRATPDPRFRDLLIPGGAARHRRRQPGHKP